MAGCCGGKDAGKPIGYGRYALGLAFFVTYHGVVQITLAAASAVSGRFVPVRRFHKEYFTHLLGEAWDRKGISLGKQSDDDACEVDLTG